MHRTVQAELLDSLPHTAPEARHSRRDLRLINGVMGNRGWFRQVLPGFVRNGERVLEVGAGDGWLARRLWPHLSRCDGLDLSPRPPDWPFADRWHQADVTRFDGWDAYRVVYGNLFFHQFDDLALADLGASIRAHTRVFVACEPLRHRRFQLLFSLLCPMIGANRVTRHDGHTSIAAGFVGDELPRLMGFAAEGWSWNLETTAFGAYRLIVHRP